MASYKHNVNRTLSHWRINQKYNKILERDLLSLARFEH